MAIGGISMGGFGALDIARLHPHEFCAVGGHSAAMWMSGGETPAGAFDDGDDFEANDVVEWAQQSASDFGDTKVWLDTGDQDPFRNANAELASALRDGGIDVTTHTWPGGHEGDYWHKHFEQYMIFYADALSSC
jgi:enterochelin esterase-like enzyme